MVTQDAAVIPKVNKMKMKKMKKKSKKKKMKGADNFDSESEADKLDLDQKIHTLSHYISDQEELVNQMFLTISGTKLEAMLPPVLKSTPLTELKRLCLHELRGMSKKRILCSINGEVMEGSSGSEDEEDDKEEAAAKDSKQNDTNAKGEKRKPGDDQAPESYLLKKIKVEPGLEDSTGSGEGKSVLELLELEMRARIIKTMLEKGDEGKKITEDAIAAVMQSAKQITKEGTDITGGSSKEAANAGAEPKDGLHEKDSEREAASEEEAVEERSRGRRKSQGKEGDRRRRRRPVGDGRRNLSRSYKRGDGSYSDEGSCGRSSKKQKEPNSFERHVTKKKKITRKEFEERMKRAKKNRTYRQRKSSEDEEKTKENEDKPEEENSKEDSEEKTEDKVDGKTQDAPTKGKITQGRAEGDASEKEEGEIDSNEEEEGACSPTDISSASQYSSSSSYSRSRSRSYSRSPSRSPYRSRQRRSRRSRSRSRSKKRRRSYSRSYSRSKSPERRRGKGDYQRRSYERKRSREPLKTSNKRDITKSPQVEDRSPSREEDWGHKCDIEFVDSEEDFDDNPETTKKDAGQKTVPVNRIERASISFSLQKKPVGIAQSVDLDDLPLKKKQTSDNVEVLGSVKPPTNEEIVISSDSEVELPGSTQGVTGKQKSSNESKTDSTEQTEKPPITSISNSRSDEAKEADTSSMKENMNLQANQVKNIKKTGDSDTKAEVEAKIIEEKSTEESSNLATDTACEINTKKDEKSIDKADSKEGSHTRDSKVSSKSMDGSEGKCMDTDDATEDAERKNRDIPPDKKQEDESESRTNPTEAFSNRSEEDSKEKDSDSLHEEKNQDDNATEIHITEIDVGKADESSFNETEVTKSPFKKSKKRETKRAVNAKHSPHIHSAEEDLTGEASVSSEIKSQTCKGLEVESRDKDVPIDSEREEKVEKIDSPVSSEQKEEADNKDVTTIFGDQSEEDFYKGTELLKFSEDEKESEETVVRELRRKRIPVEPIRLETGLIRRRVQPSRKIEMIVPEKSWMKREKKKKEKTKDVLAMEGVGLLKSTLSEGAQSSSQDSELEMETSQCITPVDSSESKEVPVKQVNSPAQVSDTENSQPLQDLSAQKLASRSPKRDTSPEASQIEDKSMRKIDHDTEIIGVIETSKDPSDNFDDMDLGGSSWSMRWLQSEKVQKVVTSSKMLSRVRKKIQKKEKATKVVMAEKVDEAQKPAESVVPVIGSIEEYERLFGTKVKKDEAAAAAGLAFQDSSGQGQASGSSIQTQGDIPEVKDKGNPVFGSDDDGEDSEEEALWSKIIKK